MIKKLCFQLLEIAIYNFLKSILKNLGAVFRRTFHMHVPPALLQTLKSNRYDINLYHEDDNSIINSLPNEILIYIFSYLHFPAAARISLVCKRWYLCNDQNLAKMKIKEQFYRIRRMMVKPVFKEVKVKTGIISYMPYLNFKNLILPLGIQCIYKKKAILGAGMAVSLKSKTLGEYRRLNGLFSKISSSSVDNVLFFEKRFYNTAKASLILVASKDSICISSCKIPDFINTPPGPFYFRTSSIACFSLPDDQFVSFHNNWVIFWRDMSLKPVCYKAISVDFEANFAARNENYVFLHKIKGNEFTYAIFDLKTSTLSKVFKMKLFQGEEEITDNTLVFKNDRNKFKFEMNRLKRKKGMPLNDLRFLINITKLEFAIIRTKLIFKNASIENVKAFPTGYILKRQNENELELKLDPGNGIVLLNQSGVHIHRRKYQEKFISWASLNLRPAIKWLYTVDKILILLSENDMLSVIDMHTMNLLGQIPPKSLHQITGFHLSAEKLTVIYRAKRMSGHWGFMRQYYIPSKNSKKCIVS